MGEPGRDGAGGGCPGGCRPRAVGVPLSLGSAAVGLAGTPQAGRGRAALRERLPWVVPGASGDPRRLERTGRRFVRRLRLQELGLLKRPRNVGAALSLLGVPPAGRPLRKRPQPLVLVGDVVGAGAAGTKPAGGAGRNWLPGTGRPRRPLIRLAGPLDSALEGKEGDRVAPVQKDCCVLGRSAHSGSCGLSPPAGRAGGLKPPRRGAGWAGLGRPES